MTDVKRPYRQKERAAKAAQTRQKIVRAAVRLHETVGPARTSLSAVAREAGVSRPTVYSHFPNEADLIRACTQHWLEEDPPPNPASWLAISDPAERTRFALREVYAHYRRNEQMTQNVFRDMHLVDSMRTFNLPLVEETLAAVTEVLHSPFADQSEVAVKRRAMISLAIRFETWQALIRRGGLSDAEAAELMAGAVLHLG